MSIQLEPKTKTDIPEALDSPGGFNPLIFPVSGTVFAMTYGFYAPNNKYIKTYRVNSDNTVVELDSAQTVNDGAGSTSSGGHLTRCPDSDLFVLTYIGGTDAFSDGFRIIRIDSVTGEITLGGKVNLGSEFHETRSAHFLSPTRLIISEIRQRNYMPDRFQDGKLRIRRYEINSTTLALTFLDQEEVIYDNNPSIEAGLPYFHFISGNSDDAILGVRYLIGPTGSTYNEKYFEFNWNTGIGTLVHSGVSFGSSSSYNFSVQHNLGGFKAIIASSFNWGVLSYNGSEIQVNSLSPYVGGELFYFAGVFDFDDKILFLKNRSGTNSYSIVQEFDEESYETSQYVEFVNEQNLFNFQVPPGAGGSRIFLSPELMIICIGNNDGYFFFYVLAPPTIAPPRYGFVVKFRNESSELFAGLNGSEEGIIDGPAISTARFLRAGDMAYVWDSVQRKPLNTGNRFYVLDEDAIRLLHPCSDNIEPGTPVDPLSCVEVQLTDGYPDTVIVPLNDAGVTAKGPFDFRFSTVGWPRQLYKVTAEMDHAAFLSITEESGNYSWVIDSENSYWTYGIAIPATEEMSFYGGNLIPEFQPTGVFTLCPTEGISMNITASVFDGVYFAQFEIDTDISISGLEDGGWSGNTRILNGIPNGAYIVTMSSPYAVSDLGISIYNGDEWMADLGAGTDPYAHSTVVFITEGFAKIGYSNQGPDLLVYGIPLTWLPIELIGT